jgi:hypothetical protein
MAPTAPLSNHRRGKENLRYAIAKDLQPGKRNCDATLDAASAARFSLTL